jgi:hypothetical protein
MLAYFLTHNAIVHAAALGALGGAAADLHVFFGYKGWGQLRQFDWSTATYRWFIGAMSGILMASGHAALVSQAASTLGS